MKKVFCFIKLLILISEVLVDNKTYNTVFIGAPEFQCGSDGKLITIQSKTTSIRLPECTEAVFSVNTEKNGNCTNVNSFCPIVTWKNIRTIEKYLNENFYNTGPGGLITFNNDLMVPGFNYLLHVILKKPDGEIITEKDYNITTFKFGENANKKYFGHLELSIGTNTLHFSMPLIVNAVVSFCGENTYYYFRWSILAAEQELILTEKSSQLSIFPSNIMSGFRDRALLKCQVLNFEDDRIISEKSMEIYFIQDTKEMDLEVYLPFKYTSINRGSSLYIHPYIQITEALKYELLYKINWLCLFNNKLLQQCEGQTSRDFFLESGFNQAGNYSITLVLTARNIRKNITCTVSVHSEGPSIDFDTSFPIKPETGIELRAKISGLRTFCTVQWNGEDLPGWLIEVHNISSTDKSFLEELVELGSLTVTREFKLKIPKPSRLWPGLLSGKTYEIFFEVTCPIYEENLNQMQLLRSVHSGQIEIFIPLSPNVDSFDVFFEDNLALVSEYLFIVTNSSHKSLLYKYGFIVNDDVEVIFYTGIDVFKVKTILPFNGDAGIDTFVEICNLERCSRKFGPMLKPVINYEFSDEIVLNNFKQKLMEEDYYIALAYSFIILNSANFIYQIEQYKNLFSNPLLEEIQKLLRKSDKVGVNKFIESFKLFSGHLEFSRDVMEILLRLFDMYDEDGLITYAKKREEICTLKLN